MTLVTLAFILYAFILCTLVFFANKHTKNFSDYLLGGRSSSGLLTALGVGASDMSSWLLLALPGIILLNGLNQIWIPLSLFIGQYLNWTLIAKRLRIYTEITHNAITIPSYFEHRFHDKSNLLRLSTAIIILIFFTVYTASGFVSGGLLLESVFDISYSNALLITGILVVGYTSVGGFLAVSWIDLFQGFLMLMALMIVPYMTLEALNGLDSSLLLIESKAPAFYLDPFNNMSTITIISLLSWGLGYFGQPHIIVRFMAMKNHHIAKKSKHICMVWMGLALIGSVLTGLLGMIYFADNPLLLPETVFVKLASVLLTPFMTGVMLAAVLSATMSTASSQLLASASAIVEDIYHRWIDSKNKSSNLLWIGKMGVLLISAIAFILANQPNSSVLGLVSYAWAGLGGSFGPIVLISLFWRRMTLQGAFFGMLVGALVVIVWPFLRDVHSVFEIYELLPSFILSSCAIFIFSICSPSPSPSIEAEFDLMKNIIDKRS